VKTFFARSADWERIACGEKPKAEVLERCVFKHRATNVYLVADAYRGREIRQAILDFLSSAAGDDPETVTAEGTEDSDSWRGESCRLYWPRWVDGLSTPAVSAEE
jgi:hypothetical protein